MYKIKGDTFPNIPLKLRIRPRAANFVKKFSAKYVVLHINEEHVQCLSIFRFKSIHENTSEDKVIEMCRCIGTKQMKRHWNAVFNIIYRNIDEIRDLNNVKDGLIIFEK